MVEYQATAPLGIVPIYSPAIVGLQATAPLGIVPSYLFCSVGYGAVPPPSSGGTAEPNTGLVAYVKISPSAS
jgi:hypothetical protein